MGTEVIKIGLLGQSLPRRGWRQRVELPPSPCWGVQPGEGSHCSRLGWTGGMGDAGAGSPCAVGTVVTRAVLRCGDQDPRKLPAHWDKMKINSPWHRFCAVCVPGAARSRRSLASGFSEVLTSDFLQNFACQVRFLVLRFL